MIASGVKCSILIVDDERYILATLAASLREEFEVLTASSGEEALEVFAQHDVDLLLCDQKMPGICGVEVLEWARKNRPKTIRLLMTGFAELEDAVEAINRGQVFRYLFKPWRIDELIEVLQHAAKTFRLERSHEQLLGELRRLNEDLENRVHQRTQELEQTNLELQKRNNMLEKLALTDELTRLPNRRAIEQILLAEMRRRARHPAPLALGLIDADHFREINRRYLLPGGDQVLKGLAKTLGDSLRASDMVGRWGGEEFLVVAPVTSLDGAAALAERIRTAVEQAEVSYQDQHIQVTVSVGFAVADGDSSLSAEQLIYRSAACLAEAKARGRNCCIVRAAEEANAVPTLEPV